MDNRRRLDPGPPRHYRRDSPPPYRGGRRSRSRSRSPPYRHGYRSRYVSYLFDVFCVHSFSNFA
jgi:hypothetical protein